VFPRLQYWDAIGTYLERSLTKNSCKLLITEALDWWRRGESNRSAALIPGKLFILQGQHTHINWRNWLFTLAQLSQLRAIFGVFAIIFVVKSCVSIAES
jgi:hypothetical protein